VEEARPRRRAGTASTEITQRRALWTGRKADAAAIRLRSAGWVVAGPLWDIHLHERMRRELARFVTGVCAAIAAGTASVCVSRCRRA
jgi:hypothetical protein